MYKQYLKLFCIQLFLLYSFFCMTMPMALAAEQVVSIRVPADILLQTITDALPIPLETQKEYIEGDVVVESLDTLKIGENQIFLKGVVLGNNLSMNTNIAGQVIKLRLGSVRLPITCELFLRFDAQKRTLFIMPKFPNPGTSKNADSADALLPLLGALGGKEYPVALDAMQSFYLQLGKKNVPFQLEPVAVGTSKGMLVIQLRPKVTKR